VDLSVDTNVSEEHTVFIFRAEDAVCSSETLVSVHKSTWRTTQKTNIDIFTAVRTSDLNKPDVSFYVAYPFLDNQILWRERRHYNFT
jgi:hypothetical protein